MISFVIPVCNEAASIETLVKEIRSLCDWGGYRYEVIFIDDGSIDATWDVIKLLAHQSENCRGIRLRRNYGKGAALSAGFKEVKGDIIFTMDGDLQDNPEDIPAFINALNSGHDIVVGWRKNRKDTFLKRIQSKLFNVAARLTGLYLHDHNCGFKCFRREVLENLHLYGDRHRYVPVLAHIEGFDVGEIEVNHRPRSFGYSKYGWGRSYRGFFDLLTILFLKGFRYRPMHFMGVLGITSIFFGLTGLGYLAIVWLTGSHIGHRPLLVYSAAALVFGSQVLATGILAELLTAYLARYENLYSIRSHVGLSPESQKKAPLERDIISRKPEITSWGEECTIE